MASIGRLRTIGKMSGVAVTTAPYVRRLASDEELRGDVSDFVRSANTLMSHVRSDKRLRQDLRNLVESAQSGADHMRGDLRPPRRMLRTFVIGTGLIITTIAFGIALAWPRSRRSVLRVADQTAQRATSRASDIRERIATQSGERRAA
jgi:hypothetical protein